MTQTLLAPHWMPEHMDGTDEAVLARWQPPVVKIINPDASRVLRAYQACPQALLFLRDHPLSEQKSDMQLDPQGTGRRHADELASHLAAWAPGVPRDRIILTGINEPAVWEMLPQTTAYNVALLDRLSDHGLKGGALNLSVGWPDNSGLNTPVVWTPYEPVHQAILRGGHYLVLHEYWSHLGPDHNWRWWAGRYQQCPWRDVKIIIGECGVDEYVADGGVAADRRGWRAWMGPDEYMGQLARYDELLRQDKRIVGATIFTYDYAHPWSSFDVKVIGDRLAAYAEAARTVSPAPPVSPPGETLPSSETATDAATLSQKSRWWLEEYVRQQEAGNATRAKAILYDLIDPAKGLFYRLERALAAPPAPPAPAAPVIVDITDSLEHGAGQYATRHLDAIDRIVIHHSASPASTTPGAIARYHVSLGWPGCGYHFIISADGRVFQTNPLTAISYHVGGYNEYSVGVCLVGNFSNAAPPEAQLAAAVSLVKWLRGQLPAADVVGHRDLGPGTACPGDTWPTWKAQIA